MGDTNGHGRLDSPAKNSEKSLTPQNMFNGSSDPFRSNSSSPLLGTEPLPLDDHTHCPYCHKDFRKPRVLDCLHSMCEDCIIAQLDGRRDHKIHEHAKDPTDCELEAPRLTERPTPPGVIRCPICFQESHVGNDVRYVHSMLLDFVRISENEEHQGEKRCRACKSEQPAVAVCKQCQSELCSNCLTAHGVMRMFDGHVVTTYEELEKKGSQSDIRPVLCAAHAQAYKVLCATCETLACKQCLELEHLNHKVIDVNDVVITTITLEIKNLMEKVEKKWRKSMNEWSSIPDRGAMLHEQHEFAKLRVEATFDELAKALEDAKARKLAELEEALHKQEQNIEDLYRKMNVNEAKVTDAITFTQRLLENANGIELCASRRKVVHQLNNLSHTMPALGIQVELEYQPLMRKQMDLQLNTLCGTVVSRTVSSASVKEVAPIGSEVANRDEWNRGTSTVGNGFGGGNALGAIGNERKKNANINGTTTRSANEFGWPPSSNPPDLPPPSPPIGALIPPGVATASVAPIRHDMNIDLNGTAVSLANSAVLGANPAAQLYSNFAWPTAANPSLPPADVRQIAAAAAAFASAQTPQGIAAAKVAQALLTFPNSQNAPNSLINANPALLMQARLRGVDPAALLAGIGNLNLSGTSTAPTASSGGPGEGGIMGGVAGTPMSQRVSDLRVHSVFGTSQQGSSIRELHCPSGFCLSETDDILIADTNNHRVVVCGPPHPWKIGRPGTDDGQLCFPRKVVALRGESPRYVVLDKGVDGKTRAQIFEVRGEFVKRINMVAIVPRGGIEVSAATATPSGQLLLVDTGALVYCIDVDTPRVVFWFDASQHLGEASDVAMFEKNIYITDFKHHCVQVFNIDGQFIRKMGEPSQTPYPIGIDVSKTGDVLVADTHGNHLHVVVFGADGQHLQSFTHNEFRLSRCVGLRIAKSGHIVTLCKHNHTLFVFKPLFLR